MKHNIISNYFLRIVAAAFFVHFLFSGARGQEQDIRWIKVGQLQSFFDDYGAETELWPYNSNTLSWPAQYGDNQHTSRMKGLWIGTRNFYDQVEIKVKTVKVVGSGPRYDPANQPLMVFSRSIKLIGKSNHPVVLVDSASASALAPYDTLDQIDPSLPCDRMIVIHFNTSLGVSVTKKILAFTQQNHDNYFVYDYVFTNTGIFNEAGNAHLQTLTPFWVNFIYKYAFAGVTSNGFGSTWGAFSSEWGQSTLYHDFGLYRSLSDSLRGFYAYYGPNKDRVGVTYAEDWGCPHVNGDSSPLDGLFGSAKYAGVVTLSASQSPQNWSDDVQQPRSTCYVNGDSATMFQIVSQYDEPFMERRYAIMTEGHLAQSHEESVGEAYTQDWRLAHTDRDGGGGTVQCQGYGPYTLAPGDSIHIVLAEGVSGMSWEKCREVGAIWFQYYKGTGTPPLVFPAGTSGTTYTDYGRAWVKSGKDSLLQTFRNAAANFHSFYTIPQPPPAPETFSVVKDRSSGSGRFRLTWASNAVSASHFDGYVIYCSAGTIKDYRTVYEKVFECNAANAVHVWEDTAISPVLAYYYYIQTKDDGTQNDIKPGTPLYSSMFLTMTSVPISLITGVENDKGTIPGHFALHQNYPNPFNPKTVISFRLAVSSRVHLKVYDMLGRDVATIVDEVKPAGLYSVTFDASKLPSGVYFYRLKAGLFAETKKLVLLR